MSRLPLQWSCLIYINIVITIIFWIDIGEFFDRIDQKTKADETPKTKADETPETKADETPETKEEGELKETKEDETQETPTTTKQAIKQAFEQYKVNMIDVKNKRCIEPDCMTRPAFNLSSETIGIYCFEHKKENMMDVKSKRCIEPDCMKQPSFNLSSETKGIYCFEHKK